MNTRIETPTGTLFLEAITTVDGVMLVSRQFQTKGAPTNTLLFVPAEAAGWLASVAGRMILSAVSP